MTRKTRWTTTTWITRFESNTIANLQTFDCRTDANNCTSGFVAKNHRIFHNVGTDCSFNPIMNIGSADTSIVYGNENIVFRFEFGNWPLLKFNRERLFENEWLVLQETRTLERSFGKQGKTWSISYAFSWYICHCVWGLLHQIIVNFRFDLFCRLKNWVEELKTRCVVSSCGLSRSYHPTPLWDRPRDDLSMFIRSNQTIWCHGRK